MKEESLPAETPFPPQQRCPCHSGEQFGTCCGRYFPPPAGQGLAAPTAVALMRSRFSAFALGNEEHLLGTWHPDTRPGTLDLDPNQRWHLLEILDTHQGGPFDQEGVVTFRAHHHQADNRRVRDSFVEKGTFSRVDGQWLYVAALEFG